ncbi:hypothetical protein C3L33_14780, partial [Rhododendron williamsianum]
MMIVDGCFMIEVLRNFTNTSNDYADNDPIFSNHGKLLIVPYIRRDMLMLENQLPMLLLTTLLDEETKDRFGIGDLPGDLLSVVEGISGGDDGAEGDNGGAHDGEEDGVRRTEDDVAFPGVHG